MANLLKKIQIGNPLLNFEMYDLYNDYQEIKSDDEHAQFLHELLNIVGENRTEVRLFIYKMMAHAINENCLCSLLKNQIKSIKGIS